MPAPTAPFTPAGAAAPAPVAAAPVVPAPVVPAPAAPGWAVEEPSVSAEPAGPAAEAVPSEGMYSRGAIEESSEFEAGLLTDLLVEVLDKGASDLHITAG